MANLVTPKLAAAIKQAQHDSVAPQSSSVAPEDAEGYIPFQGSAIITINGILATVNSQLDDLYYEFICGLDDDFPL